VHLLRTGIEYRDVVVFHAQQAAEKYLKAFLVWQQTEFTKTHDIGRLVRLAGEVDRPLVEVLAGAADLTPYGVEYRYPSDNPEVTGPDAERAMDLASLVRAEIRRRLPPETLP
jgi:HEPN domain-containing protein